MTDDKLIDLWSEDDLDRALDALHDDVPTDQGALARSRAVLLEVTGDPGTAYARPLLRRPRRRWVYSLAAAASVAALVATGFLVTGNSPGTNAAAEDLGKAAAHITSSDPVVPPGRFRHVVTHDWEEVVSELEGGGGITYLEEAASDLWIPSDQGGEWIQRSHVTGRRILLSGTQADLKRLPAENPVPAEQRARCGDFVRDAGQQACAVPGGWSNPTAAWIAGLPRDPKELYDRLKKDAPKNSRGETELMVYATDALSTGRLPADVRAALYRALGYLHHLEVTDRAVNLDGRKGIAFGSDDGTNREEIIVDPATGQFIGRRQISTSGESKGQVVSFSAVTTSVTGPPTR